MPNDGACAFSAAANNEQHVEHWHPNECHAIADECHANDVPTIVKHGGNQATANNVRNAA